MIESEQKRERLLGVVKGWCSHTKVTHLLREGDIPSLVDQILEEFYHVTLCCGHMTRSMEDSVHIAFKENDGSTVSGLYCSDCAEGFKQKLGAWEVQP